jgi:amino acid adenylation domain-containing protein
MNSSLQGVRLSAQQRHLWELQRNGATRPYRAQCAVRIEGSLDAGLLRQAIDYVVSRHEILRTSFAIFPGMSIPVQVIRPAGLNDSYEVNLRGLDPLKQEAEIDALFRHMPSRPCDGEDGPPLHAVLVTRSETSRALLISMPALCADWRTLENLVGEIGCAYQALRHDRRLPVAMLQYADVSEIFNELLESQETEEGRRYWKQPRFSASATLMLHFEKLPAEAATFAPHTFGESLETYLVSEITAITDANSASAAALLLACWQVLLWRLTGETEVTVGVAYDGRTYEGLDQALGLFAKYLPLHCHLDSETPFAHLLRATSRDVDEAYDYQEFYSPGLNHDHRGDEAGPGFLPYCFSYHLQPAPVASVEVSFSIYKRQVYLDQWKLNLCCTVNGGSIKLEFQYDSARFSAAPVTRLAEQYHTLVRSAVCRPQAAIGDLDVLSPNQRQQLLVGFNQTDRPYTSHQCVHQLLEQQVARAPDRLAAIFAGQHISYATLDARANQLAWTLQALGVGPEATVGLYLGRSLEMLIGLLSIWKAGGAYIPVDPTSPQDRIDLMLEEAGASVLLTEVQWKSAFAGRHLSVICLDEPADAAGPVSGANPISQATAVNLAYVIYTSGSTGRPKGVMVEHASVVNLAAALREAIYAEQAGPLRISLNAPLTFDASVKQLTQLLYGHTLHILPDEVCSDPRQSEHFLREQGMDVLDCTPSQLKPWLDAWLSDTPTLRLVVVGGEALDQPTWTRLSHLPETTFVNVYGPTECTVDSAACKVNAAPEQPTIGSPVANVRIYIADRRLNLAPVGVQAELHIGGAGLARGYLRQPALTAEWFIPDPFGSRPGMRLYKTGDLAAFFPDAKIKFVGRGDHQIKLRGFRIEPGEVETRLCEHPDIEAAVVEARKIAPDAEPQLVAYIVASPTGPFAQAGGTDGPSLQIELRRFLRRHLPEYMVPSIVVPLAKLPLNHHRKLDRQALPDPQPHTVRLPATHQAPRNELERHIAAIWQQVLQVEKVDVHDNFFDLGGHSLLMARAFELIKERFGDGCSMMDLFRHPTVSTLAQYLARDGQRDLDLTSVEASVQRQRAARQRHRQNAPGK